MKDLLPLGSVVLLNDSNKRVMIVGRMQRQISNNVLWDYAGVLYPEGMLSAEKNYTFNRDQIAAVFFIGFQDREELEFKILLQKKLDELREQEEQASKE